MSETIRKGKILGYLPRPSALRRLLADYERRTKQLRILLRAAEKADAIEIGDASLRCRIREDSK